MELKLGSLHISGFAGLAPMAGVADRAMREICLSHGASFCMGELASAKGIVLGDAHSAEYLSCSDLERPFGVQLFGSEPDIMYEATKVALKEKPDFIDINMGCPAPKIAVSSKGGSALLKDIDLAGRIVEAVVSAAGKTPVTVKMRTGWDEEHIVAPRLAELCEQKGAAAVTVHGRTKAQMYAPGVDTETIKKVKKSVSIPVIANGDITDGPSCAKMYEETGCDFCLVGRAAMGNPWVFEEINAYLQNGVILPPRDTASRLAGLIKHAKKMIEYRTERRAMLEIRKHAAWYMKGFRGAAELRHDCGSITTFEQLIEVCKKAQELSGGNV